MILADRYQRRCRLHRVIDGDTVVVDIDLGFGLARHGEYLRLFGVDTPEMNDRDPIERSRAREATEFTRLWLAAADLNPLDGDGEWPLLLRTIKDRRGKYGRLLVRVYRWDGTELCQSLLDGGHAKRYGLATRSASG